MTRVNAAQSPEMRTGQPVLIELNAVHKIYAMGDQEVRALDGVDLRVQENEFVAIMGPSGSGESTLMRVLVAGSGGREHALCWAIAASPLVDRVYCAPGNAGIAEEAECVSLAASGTKGIIAFCRQHLAHFKAPRHVVFGPLPKTSTGKIQKYVLRERAKEGG